MTTTCTDPAPLATIDSSAKVTVTMSPVTRDDEGRFAWSTQDRDGLTTYYCTNREGEGIRYWRENWWTQELWGQVMSLSEFTVRDCSPVTRRRRIVTLLTNEGFQVSTGPVPALKDHPEATSSIRDEAFLAALGPYPAHRERPTALWSLARSFPEHPWESVLAKARNLILRGRIEGCGCGCRGDFTPEPPPMPVVPEPVTEAEIAAAAEARAVQLAEWVTLSAFQETHRTCDKTCFDHPENICVGDCGLTCGECGDQDHIDRPNGDVDDDGVPSNQARYALLQAGGSEEF